MTKPTNPVDAAEVVEMDAMDVGEWEGEQLTPQTSDLKLAKLLKQATSAEPVHNRPPTVTVPTPRTTTAIIARPPTATSTPIPVVRTVPALPKRAIVIPSVAPRAAPPVARRPIVIAPEPPPPLVVIAPPAPAPPPVVFAPIVAPSVSVNGAQFSIQTPTADATGGGPYSVAVLQPIREPQPAPYVPHDERGEPPAPPRSRRAIALVGAAVACVVVVIVIAVAASGGHRDPPSSPVVASAPPTPPPDKPTPPPIVPTPPPVTPPAAIVEPPPTVPVAPKPAPRVAPKRIASKKLVLDYDKAAAPKVEPAKSDDQALTKARAAYAAGNRRLFAGDPNGAIREYHQALAVYPGYVAGYRGLGLAYAQLGDKPKALAAFRTYVNLVPNAKDSGLIKRRIATLGS